MKHIKSQDVYIRAKKYIIFLLVVILSVGVTTFPAHAESDRDNEGKRNIDKEAAYKSDAITIKEVLTQSNENTEVYVQGQLVYFTTPHIKDDKRIINSYHNWDIDVDDIWATYGRPVIQSVVDGQTYSLYIDGAAPLYSKVGDLIEFKGTYAIENGFPMLTKVTSKKKIGTEALTEPDTVTIAQLKAEGFNMLGRYVRIKDVTLGKYNEYGLTNVADKTGNINILNTSPYPSLIKEGDIVDLYAVVACNEATIFLYVGKKEINGHNTYDDVYEQEPPQLSVCDPYPIYERDSCPVNAEANDNRGIKAVTVSYAIDDMPPVTELMKYDTYNKSYSYLIPDKLIPDNATKITYTVTATDLSGISTSETKEVMIKHTPEIICLSPDPGEDVFYGRFGVFFTCYNFGEMPMTTLVLSRNNDVYYNGAMQIQQDDYNRDKTCYIGFFPSPDPFPVGEYDAKLTITRRSDGFTITKSWKFTLSDWD